MFTINGEQVVLEDLIEFLKTEQTLVLGEKAKVKIQKCRTYLDEKIENSSDNFYGINTGFGSLYDQSISKKDLKALQVNLVRSHACGTGEEVPTNIVKYMLLLKALGLSFGHSGAQLETVERLIDLYNNNVIPVVYQQGSLGASGDLSPLAHIALTLIGEGEVYYRGEIKPSIEVMDSLGLKPISLKSKEGLALLNGTQFMSAYLLDAVIRGKQLVEQGTIVAAMSIEAYDGRIEPFYANVNEIRRQKGQIFVAEKIRTILSDSKLMHQPKKHVQDPYCLRCIPQVHGASIDTLNYAIQILENEINAVTDNPTIFPDEDLIISAGNFHGQPLATTMDYLAIALAELGSISERRVYKLMGGQRDLPAFLVANPGLNSGFMIAQYTAASIVSQNKQLCTPCSVDSIDSSNGQEDHVSMGANAATKLHRVIENLTQVYGIELMAAAQALDFRDISLASGMVKGLHKDYRSEIEFINEDRYMSELMRKSKSFVSKMNYIY